jgi:hypothetical protein
MILMLDLLGGTQGDTRLAGALPTFPSPACQRTATLVVALHLLPTHALTPLSGYPAYRR